MLPNVSGGANWQGAAADPETGLLYVPSATDPGVGAVIKDAKRSSMDYVPGGEGGPRTSQGCGSMGPQGLPLVKPPWGRVTAVDLKTGEHAWMVPNGEAPDCVKNHPALKGTVVPRTGKPERGGLLVTKSLLFAGEGSGLRYVSWAGGPMFRAFDKSTGAILSEFQLPANQTGNPMTYLVGGRQYIVVAVGARNHPSELVALTVE
jgi:quinoprotein glucose dehydrogenase